MVYSHIPAVQRNNFSSKAKTLRFIGYIILSKAYRLSDDDTLKVYVRRDVTFNESDFNRAPILEIEKERENLETQMTVNNDDNVREDKMMKGKLMLM
jgi:hypothetical protein